MTNKTLNDQELLIIQQHKQWGFGAYLAWAWLEYPDLQETIAAGISIEPQRLHYTVKRMRNKKYDFDFCYFDSLPRQPVNPLIVEQDAWRLLSPLVDNHIKAFDRYLEGYVPETVDMSQLLFYVAQGFSLLNKWNVISKLFGVKCDIAAYKKLSGYANIPDEKWFRDIPEMERAVIDLIQELATS